MTSLTHLSSTSNRRSVLKVGAASIALSAMHLRFPMLAHGQEAASPTTDVCVLTPEQTEGPFYLPLELIRQDIC
ncbi:MAG: hypothetical protein K0Q89_530 [Thermomicrobiales bacterium]|nr:hypothetical protein [Thermomicrobiales bacterium]